MNKAIFLLVPALLSFRPVRSLAQELNSWGSLFDCAVDWFSQCTVVRENRIDEPTKLHVPSANTSSLSGKSTTANLPLPVRNVLENPSAETAKAYVLWSRQANEKLAKASEYIAQATREINLRDTSSSGVESNTNAASGLGPVGLYYVFSPDDETALTDVAVLNKIFEEGRLGVVGIPVRGKDEEIMQFLNEAKPLFPVRRSDAEVRMIKPSETPELHLALPLKKKIFRIGSVISETVIKQAIDDILVTVFHRKSRSSPLASAATDRP
jgi:hypothetical protein